jgi:hypothetical protein
VNGIFIIDDVLWGIAGRVYSIALLVGLKLWRSLNAFVELTENERHKDAELGACCKAARVGTITQRQLAILNTRLALTREQAVATSPANALWLSGTNRATNAINESFFSDIRREGNPAFRLWARHLPVNGAGVEHPVEHVRRELLEVKGGKRKNGGDTNEGIGPNFIDLALGSRVSLTTNPGTMIDLYNGAMGTVHGFAFPGSLPSARLNIAQAAEADAKPPVVFVKFDKYQGKPFCIPPKGEVWAADDERYRIVPVCAVGSFSKMRAKYHRWQLPLMPAHACTIHRSQGQTKPVTLTPAQTDVEIFAMGLEYVAISRPEYLADLMLLSPLRLAHFTSHQPTRRRIEEEYHRLRATIGCA